VKEILMKKVGKKFVVDKVEEQENHTISAKDFQSMKSPAKVKSVGMKVHNQPLVDFLEGFNTVSVIFRGL